jgi:hypothetical protein
MGGVCAGLRFGGGGNLRERDHNFHASVGLLYSIYRNAVRVVCYAVQE